MTYKEAIDSHSCILKKEVIVREKLIQLINCVLNEITDTKEFIRYALLHTDMYFRVVDFDNCIKDLYLKEVLLEEKSEGLYQAKLKFNGDVCSFTLEELEDKINAAIDVYNKNGIFGASPGAKILDFYILGGVYYNKAMLETSRLFHISEAVCVYDIKKRLMSGEDYVIFDSLYIFRRYKEPFNDLSKSSKIIIYTEGENKCLDFREDYDFDRLIFHHKMQKDSDYYNLFTLYYSYIEENSSYFKEGGKKIKIVLQDDRGIKYIREMVEIENELNYRWSYLNTRIEIYALNTCRLEELILD